MNSYSSLTLKYLKQHKGRTLLTLFGIIIAIAMFSAIGTFYFSAKNSEVERTKRDTGNAEVYFSNVTLDKIKLLEGNAELKNGGIAKEAGILSIENIELTQALKNLTVKAYDENTFKNIFKINLVAGRLPQNSSEIVIDKKFFNVLNEKGNTELIKGIQLIDNSSIRKEYKIVGAFESKGIQSYGITALDQSLLKEGKFTYFASLKQKKGKIAAAEKVAKAADVSYETNNQLLYLYGEGPSKTRNDALFKVIIVIIVFVVLCTVVVIYNAFNISVMERVKHFGILRSLGATKKQIRTLVFKEAIIMSAIAIPLGILFGYLGLYITFRFTGNMFFEEFGIVFKPEVAVVGAALGILTIFMSAFFPARTASKVSPIDAIRGTTVLKGEKIKRRRSFFTRFLFSFEGEVAYKNIKRSRKRFYITCVSLTISLVMFVFFSNITDIFIKSSKILYGNIAVEAYFEPRRDEKKTLMDENFINKLASIEGIANIYKTNQYKINLPLEKNKLQERFLNLAKSNKNFVEYGDKYLIPKGMLISFDEKAFQIAKEKNNLKLDYTEFKNGKAIIINKARGTENKKSFMDAFTSYKQGDKINLPLLNADYLANPSEAKLRALIDSRNSETFEVAAVIESEPLTDAFIDSAYGIVISDESFKKFTGISVYNNISLRYQSKDYSEKLFEKLNIMADENNILFADMYNDQKETEKQVNQLFVLVYGFITLIVLISTVNIVNTVTINLLVKKREYAVFKAIGMTKVQFMKLVLLEGTLFGIFSVIVGIPVAYLLSKYGITANNPLGDIGYKSALWPYLYGALGIILITSLAAMYPLRKLNDMNIIEALRIEE
jgi:putative ABC transport system permease protein